MFFGEHRNVTDKDITSMNRRRKVVLAILGLIALVAGLLVYLKYGKNTWIAQKIRYLYCSEEMNSSDTRFGILLRNWGADALWMVSFTIFIQIILWPSRTRYLVFCALVGGIWELMQLCGLVGGTADVFDLLAYLIGTLIAIALIKTVVKEKKYE